MGKGVGTTVKSMSALLRLRPIREIQTELFGTFFNPKGNLRTGRKLLRAQPYGPAIASYYPTTLYDLRKHDPIVKDHFNSVWHEKNEARRQAGKKAPKKGEGKRASKKK
eukprot:c5434_g1_i2.p2 GENE.c5434_g1_i2~~c5434_g1_i2.p2  ORF type:complete len:109 (-),score=5.38 c5434_g1_i2:175-501(-)